MGNYLDVGYDQFLSRAVSAPNVQEIDPLQFENNMPEISASKIQGGILQTKDGKTIVNMDKGFFQVSDEALGLIRLGVQEDGAIGFLVKDRNENVLVQFTGNINLIQSPNQNFQADFNNEYILAKDEGGTPRALFGKGDF